MTRVHLDAMIKGIAPIEILEAEREASLGFQDGQQYALCKP